MLAVTGAAASGAASLKYDFDTVSANLPLLLSARPGATALAFALFLVGFGIKMGMWPFGQFWLPDAHPAAPSPVSAMLSGVMIKTGVYGLMRYFLWLVPAGAQADYPLARWGLRRRRPRHHHAVYRHHAGAQAGADQTPARLPQHRADRLHPAGHGRVHGPAAGGGPDAAALAAIAFFGALFHVLNHGLFKALLFLNAGSMLHATGTQDLNKMGGLMKFMPLTAVTALVASFSISGRAAVQRLRQQVEHLRGGGPGQPVGQIPGCVRGDRHPDQRADPGLVHQVLRRELPVAHQRAGQPRRQPRKGRLEVGWTMQAAPDFARAGCVLLGLLPAMAFQPACSRRWKPAGRLRRRAGRCRADGGRAAGRAASDQTSAALFAPLALAVVLGLAFLRRRTPSRELGGARRAAPQLRGSAAMRARRIAIAMSRTISTAKSNAISAGSAARRAPQPRTTDPEGTLT